MTRHSDGKSAVLRYEDFVAAPRASLIALMRLQQPDFEPPDGLFGDNWVEIRPHHAVRANAKVREQVGHVSLSADERWSRLLRRRDRSLVDALTWPARARYGY